jgi:hypothetical protein
VRYLILAAVTAALLSPAVAGALPLRPPDTGGGVTIVPAPPLVNIPPVVTTPPPQPSGGSSSGGGSSSTGVTWPSGCRTVDLFTEQKSFLFHVRIYRFHQVKHWCWRGGAIYDERHAWEFDGSSTACLDVVYLDNAWYFAWVPGKPQSGHYSEERAHATNCVFHVGDWKEFYPDVRIWAYADGTYKVTTAN